MNRVSATLPLVGLLFVACTESKDSGPGELSVSDRKRVQRITYAHGGEVVVREGVANGVEKIRLKEVSDPCLSPDGRALVVTRGGAGGTRTLAVIDLETKKERSLTIPNARQVFGCTFAPDGSWILFNQLNEGLWNVGAVRPDGNEVRVLTAGLENKTGWFLAGINYKTGRALTQNLREIVELEWNGTAAWRARIVDLLGDFGVSSSCRFIIDRKGTSLFADVEADESLPGMDGPTGALVSVELATKKLNRLTPPKLSVSEPWLDAGGESLYFTACAPGKTGRGASCNGYRMLLAKRQPELWVKGGSFLSTSNP